MDAPKMESVESMVSEGIENFLPENAKHLLEGATTWIKDHPTEAALIGAGAGLLVGLTGFGRLYSGVKTLRSMPLVSQLVLGALAAGFGGQHSEESVH